MIHTHCTGPGQGPGTMGFYIMLCTVHTTQGLGQGTIVLYRACPGPGPVPEQCIYGPRILKLSLFTAYTIGRKICQMAMNKGVTSNTDRSQLLYI